MTGPAFTGCVIVWGWHLAWDLSPVCVHSLWAGLCSEKLVREKNYVPTLTGKSCSYVLSILGGCYKLLLQASLLIIVLFSFSNQVAQELKICASIINMFYLIPAASSKLIEPLINLVLKVEKSLLMEVSNGQD